MNRIDFDVPVTDEFLDRVRRGVRRRRALRIAVATCVIAGLSAVAAVGWPRPPGPPLPAASPSSAPADVDRYRITHLPAGIRLDPHRSSSVVAVTASGPADRVPERDEAGAAVSMRRFEQVNGGSWLWITVLRPLPLSPGMERPVITQHLLGTQAVGAEVVETFFVPAGSARLMRTPSDGAPAHDVLITAPDGTVISIGGNARVPVTDLRAVAAGLLPT